MYVKGKVLYHYHNPNIRTGEWEVDKKNHY